MTELITELHSMAQRMAAAGETDEPVTVSLAAEEIERLRAEVEKLTRRNGLIIEEAERESQHNRQLRIERFRQFGNEDCWIWGGDGHDNLETLVCPVVMQPQQLIEILQERDQLRAEIEKLKTREAALGDLQYAEGAKRGFEWGQHDDTEALAACVEGRVPEAVRELKELRHEIEMRKLQVIGAAKVIQEEKNDNSKLREECDQLKSEMKELHEFSFENLIEAVRLEGILKENGISVDTGVAQSLAEHNAEVIERAADEVWPGSSPIAKGIRLLLSDYANQLRQQAKEVKS